MRRQPRKQTGDRVWREFAEWCRVRRLRPLPAHPWTVAAYLRWCEARQRPGSLADRIRSIARAHLFACLPSPDRDPVVDRTLAMLKLRDQNRSSRAALFDLGIGAPNHLVTTEDPEPFDPSLPLRTLQPRPTLRATPRLVRRRPPPG
ncbi:MAG: hypothetical protein HC834_08460 [Rhodospirillales bacterium]|nr:hypothetical protein [Rhodospirillales bacterium]